jgi:Trp operon repressor
LYTQLVDILKNFVQTEFDLLLFQSEVGNRLSLMENLIALAQRQVKTQASPSPTTFTFLGPA